ncbi:MAG: 3-hydroxyacyl-ACP dehydratase FabZ [Gammaproteobacteria bacterium]|jgi:3-hydroxyacyl-[acyl-carrier-protein] dehydratase|nr:3-hydroxyacyl-ACP dehydratase FabZ [Gammaproteobacteria bacterium]
MTILNINQIKKVLPHRYPFLLVDKVTEFESGVYLKAIKNVTVNEPFFQGHFPTQPIMPGVLIIEAMAQATALYGELAIKGGMDDDILYYLVGVDKARFRQTVGPGDQLVLQVNFVTVKRNIWKFSTTAKVDDKLVASAELMTTIADPQS